MPTKKKNVMPTKEASRFRRCNSGLAAETPPTVGVTTTIRWYLYFEYAAYNAAGVKADGTGWEEVGGDEWGEYCAVLRDNSRPKCWAAIIWGGGNERNLLKSCSGTSSFAAATCRKASTQVERLPQNCRKVSNPEEWLMQPAGCFPALQPKFAGYYA